MHFPDKLYYDAGQAAKQLNPFELITLPVLQLATQLCPLMEMYFRPVSGQVVTHCFSARC